MCFSNASRRRGQETRAERRGQETQAVRSAAPNAAELSDFARKFSSQSPCGDGVPG